MKQKLLEHLSSLLFVSAILVGILAVMGMRQDAGTVKKDSLTLALESLPVSSTRDAFHRALLKDVVNIYYPGQYDKTSATVNAVIHQREVEFARSLQSSHVKEGLTWGRFAQILGMYAKFLVIYVLVLALTYYGVQTIGTWRFVRRKSRAESRQKHRELPGLVRNAAMAVPKALAYAVLFSPAYVVAYSVRTEFNTDSGFFLVLLATMCNGLLIMYSNKFYAFLVSESRRGYVETAMAKNLVASYDKVAIPLKTILRPFKKFDGHVFGHIFANARQQYFSSVKEQASFLITGLVITEMALNIHGYLSYEMLRQLLYKNFSIVIVILLLIFITVKMTEILVDVKMHRESMRFENRTSTGGSAA